MPLPFLLLGLAGAAGLFGVGSAAVAWSENDDANNLNDEARDIFDEAKKSLERSHKRAKKRMEACGKAKLEIYEDVIIPFCRSVRRIKNIDLNEITVEQDAPSMTDREMKELDEVSLKMEEVIAGGVGALGAGGLAGLAAYGGTMAFATASTGTAIGALSGVAATNATLAWLGGGALGTSATAMGMAGGMAVLGGIVAAPVLLIGGVFMAAKASAAKEKAYANRDLAEKNAEEMKTAEVAVDAIGERFEQICSLLEQLQSVSDTLFEDFRRIVAKKADYRKFTKTEKASAAKAFSTAKVIKSVIDATVLANDGTLVKGTSRVLSSAETYCGQLT